MGAWSSWGCHGKKHRLGTVLANGEEEGSVATHGSTLGQGTLHRKGSPDGTCSAQEQSFPRTTRDSSEREGITHHRSSLGERTTFPRVCWHRGCPAEKHRPGTAHSSREQRDSKPRVDYARRQCLRVLVLLSSPDETSLAASREGQARVTDPVIRLDTLEWRRGSRLGRFGPAYIWSAGLTP